jgi:spore coat protein A
LAPAERADVIVDFTGYNGRNIVLTNDAPTPFPNGNAVHPETTGQIMQFRVSRTLKKPDSSSIPDRLIPISKLMVTPSTKVRNLTLDESRDRFGRLMMLLDKKRWEEPITEKPRLGDTEVWQLINLTEDTHPIHLHLVHFQIINRQPFNVKEYPSSGKLQFTGPAVSPAPNEKGWKDTVRANPGEVTRIVARFSPFTGEYVWHCHILEHEDHEMMRPYKVIEKPLENSNEITIHFKSRKKELVIESIGFNQK